MRHIVSIWVLERVRVRHGLKLLVAAVVVIVLAIAITPRALVELSPPSGPTTPAPLPHWVPVPAGSTVEPTAQSDRVRLTVPSSPEGTFLALRDLLDASGFTSRLTTRDDLPAGSLVLEARHVADPRAVTIIIRRQAAASTLLDVTFTVEADRR